MTEAEFRIALETIGNLGLSGIARWLEALAEHSQEAHNCEDARTFLEMLATRLRHLDRQYRARRIPKSHART